jgi:hypothetical protein
MKLRLTQQVILTNSPNNTGIVVDTEVLNAQPTEYYYLVHWTDQSTSWHHEDELKRI